MMLLYHGPSRINGAPIVAIATHKSANAKTGDVIQTWILPADLPPHHAVKAGADAAVCGDCPHRHHTGGACYVLPFQVPRGVYAAWRRGSYDKARHKLAFERARKSKMIRLGAYGDPAAVPAEVWHKLLDGAVGWTGYTHQWHKPWAQDMRGLCMASVDSEAEARHAASMGWRYFRVLGRDESSPGLAGSVECLSDSKGRSCAECRICNGARMGKAVQPTSVWIDVHGARSKRFRPKGLAVVA